MYIVRFEFDSLYLEIGVFRDIQSPRHIIKFVDYIQCGKFCGGGGDCPLPSTRYVPVKLFCCILCVGFNVPSTHVWSYQDRTWLYQRVTSTGSVVVEHSFCVWEVPCSISGRVNPTILNSLWRLHSQMLDT